MEWDLFRTKDLEGGKKGKPRKSKDGSKGDPSPQKVEPNGKKSPHENLKSLMQKAAAKQVEITKELMGQAEALAGQQQQPPQQIQSDKVSKELELFERTIMLFKIESKCLPEAKEPPIFFISDDSKLEMLTVESTRKVKIAYTTLEQYDRMGELPEFCRRTLPILYAKRKVSNESNRENLPADITTMDRVKHYLSSLLKG